MDRLSNQNHFKMQVIQTIKNILLTETNPLVLKLKHHMLDRLPVSRIYNMNGII
jgi:hypothetical protein